jgi:uncharacterized protein (TIGR00369 family)
MSQFTAASAAHVEGLDVPETLRGADLQGDVKLSGVPEGFVRHSRRSGLTDPWEPIYARQTADALVLAVRAAEPHCNARGFVHGGLISALADNAMGLSCRLRLLRDKGDDFLAGLVTVTLDVDFLEAAESGAWLRFETDFIRAGSTLCFAESSVTANGTICARARARFRVIRPHSQPSPDANTHPEED